MEITPEFIETLWIRLKEYIPPKSRRESCFLFLKTFMDYGLLNDIDSHMLQGIDKIMDKTVEELFQNYDDFDYYDE